MEKKIVASERSSNIMRNPVCYPDYTYLLLSMCIMILSMTVHACAGISVLTPNEVLNSEPTDESILIVGCVIVDIVDRSVPPFLEPPYRVTVAHESSGGDRPIKCYLIQSDSLGYFALQTKSAGKYWLFQVGSSTGAGPWVIRRGFENNWMQVDDISADLPISPPRDAKTAGTGDNIDFDYQFLAYDHRPESRTRGRVLSRELKILDGVTFHSGIVYNRPSVAEFFIHQYPHTGWITRLRSILSRSTFR